MMDTLSTAGSLLSTVAPPPLPAPRVEIAIRPATHADFPAIDRLQKMHSRQLAFLNKPTIEGKIDLGQVLIAEGKRREEGRRHEGKRQEGGPTPAAYHLPGAFLVGYLIGNDRYKHRDELGVIFQLCVDPNYRRSLVAANLLKAQFERSAWGCKLYCCWCAQDLVEANRFYEAMGFVPIAYRAGSLKRGSGVRGSGSGEERPDRHTPRPSPHTRSARTHIFWQKRIREGDVTTPWWFPSETTGGLMDASRIALPILPGVNWWDELPLILPTEGEQTTDGPTTETRQAAQPGRVKAKPLTKLVPPTRSGVTFGRPGTMPTVSQQTEQTKATETAPQSRAIEKPAKVKKAPAALASRARELRDKYLEQVNGLSITSAGKYDVARRIEKAGVIETKLLAA